MAALVLRGTTVIARGAVGLRARGHSQEMGPNDEFQICSCTKAMTAMVVAEAIERGSLRWDTSLAEIFGGEFRHIDPGWRAATIRLVLSQQGGFAADGRHWFIILKSFLFRRGTLVEQRRRLAERVLSHPPDYPPGERNQYSNIGYVVVAAALERVTGHSWEDLVRSQIFDALGMTTGGFGPPGSPGKVDEPWGHGSPRLFYEPVPILGCRAYNPGNPGADYPGVYGPAGRVHVSLPDWAKFVAAELRAHPANPNRQVTLLRASTYDELFKPVTPKSQFVCGWMVGTRSWARGNRPGDTGRVLYHDGDNGRWTCVAWMAPEIDTAFVIACNRGGRERACDAVAAALAGRYAVTAPLAHH